MTHTYLLIAALPSSPSPTERTSSRPRKIINADYKFLCLGSLNRISPNFYKVYRNVCRLLCWNQNCDLPIHFETPMWHMKIVLNCRCMATKIARFNSVNSEFTRRKLTKFEKKVQIHHIHKELSYGEKIAKIGPVYPEIFDKIRRTTWTRNAISICWHVLRRNYWTNLHQNFTRYSGIHDAIIFCIQGVILFGFRMA